MGQRGQALGEAEGVKFIPDPILWSSLSPPNHLVPVPIIWRPNPIIWNSLNQSSGANHLAYEGQSSQSSGVSENHSSGFKPIVRRESDSRFNQTTLESEHLVTETPNPPPPAAIICD